MDEKQFEPKAGEYAGFISSDPMRLFLHYPSVERKLGKVKGKLVLDKGCGDGLFSRRLSQLGAKVVGYDASPSMVKLARESEGLNPLRIEYQIATPVNFRHSSTFDNAVSVMVLPYSPSAAYLKHFFACAYRHLKKGGKFVSVVFNPDFAAFGEVIGNRRFEKLPGKQVKVRFLHPVTKQPVMDATLRQFAQADYRKAAKAAGFNGVSFEPLIPSAEGIKALGKEFWKSVGQNPPYIMVTVRKND